MFSCLLLSVFDVNGQVPGKAQVFDESRCPVFQNGNPGQPNVEVTFFDTLNNVVAVCNCQLTGNELKCHNCKPNDSDFYYYQVVRPPDTIDTLNCFSSVYLSVTLSYFNVQLKDGKVVLDWETLSEINNSHFRVERSADGSFHDVVGKKKGNGTTSQPNQYQFSDEFPDPKKKYYRIVQVDIDGVETIYPWHTPYKVNLLEQATKVTLAPNPNNGYFNFIVHEGGLYRQLDIYELTGKRIRKFSLVRGANWIFSDLPTGTYIVKAWGDGYLVKQTLLVDKSLGATY